MTGHSRPSYLVNEIYNIMEDYETEGIDTYDYRVINAIIDYLTNECHTDKYQMSYNVWPNMIGGYCSIAVVDNDYPFLIAFDYKY